MSQAKLKDKIAGEARVARPFQVPGMIGMIKVIQGQNYKAIIVHSTACSVGNLKINTI